ncbi:histone-lysine N-methyltransferase SETMAR [Trichonephila clavipes]|nr:histone-lysine N-methyltransferase SETMAR [Trichonephila clavipes]
MGTAKRNDFFLPLNHCLSSSTHTEHTTWGAQDSSCSLNLIPKKVNKEKIRFILQFFYDEGKNASQVTEIANGGYGADTVTANFVQFWFGQFRSGIFDVKDAPHTGRPVVENVGKIQEIIEVDWHNSNRGIAQEQKIDHKIVLSICAK